MKKIIVTLIFIFTSNINSQIDLSAGMGLSFFTAPDFEIYANSISGIEAVNSFNTSADFFAEIGYTVNSKYQIALEYNFNIYSVNSPIIDIDMEKLRLAEENGAYLDTYRFDNLDFFFGMAEQVKIRLAS